MKSVKYYDLLDLEYSYDSRYEGTFNEREAVILQERLEAELELIVQFYDSVLNEHTGRMIWHRCSKSYASLCASRNVLSNS